MVAAVEMLFVLASLLLAGAAWHGSAKAWHLANHPVDFAMRVLAAVWFLYLLASVAQPVFATQLQPVPALQRYIFDLLRVCMLASLAFFLVTASGLARPWVLLVIGLYLGGSVVATSWLTLLSWPNPSKAASPAIALSALALAMATAAVVTGSVIRQVRHTQSRRSWLVLAACAAGLSLWLHHAVSEVAVPAGGQSTLPAVFYLYAFFIFVVFKLISLAPDANNAVTNPNGRASTLFDQNSQFQTMTSVHTDDQFVALALKAERQRISHELHDNVGSQIVSILFAMQGAEQPQKRLVMLSLEQCLTDLKLTVDALDSFDENVTQSLGRLRYRVQHALDRQGVKMRWDVDLSDELDAVRGIYAQQALRIAQESVANVMRHAKARTLKVTCRFVPEFCHLLLEVVDDGVGLPANETHRSAGQGLASMKRRAAAVGGNLHVSGHAGSGTCVRLTVPLPHITAKPKNAIARPAAEPQGTRASAAA